MILANPKRKYRNDNNTILFNSPRTQNLQALLGPVDLGVTATLGRNTKKCICKLTNGLTFKSRIVP